MKKSSSLLSPPRVALLIETSTEYGRGLLRGILRYSRLHGPWSLYVSPGHLDQVLPTTKSWGGTGIIARIASPEVAKEILATRLPCVASSLIESWAPTPGACFGEIRTAPEAISRAGAGHLLEARIRAFAFCGFNDCPWSSRREMEFVRIIEQQSYPCFRHRINWANWMQQSNWISNWNREESTMVRWLRNLPKPLGLMACNDACGRQVLQACATAGLQVPDEVAVVGVDNDEMLCELSNPPLSSIALDVEKAGYEAAALLDRMMNGERAEGQVVWVRPTHVAARRSSDVIAQDDQVVAAALKFIRDNGKMSISVDHVAEQAGVARRTLERRFLRAFGRSVLSEITRCRLERAKQMLLETDLPAQKVAREAGFGSLKTLNRAFGRHVGTTPGNFRAESRIAFASLLGGRSAVSNPVPLQARQ